MAHRSRIAIIYVLSFCLCFVKTEEFTSCETNADCEEHKFCYEFSKICASCIPCHLYNRRNSEWTKCAEKPLQCGSCLDGYWEEILTRGEKRALCLKNRSSTEEAHNYSLRIHIILSIICSCTVVCIAGVSYAALRYRRKQRIRANGSNELMQASDSPPPYYARDIVQLSSDCDRPTIEISTPRSGCMTFNVEAESLQKANPFRQPDYDRPERREETFEPNDSTDTFDLHNEDTMPSSWTPYERSEIDGANIPHRESDVRNGFSNESTDSSVRTPRPTVFTNGVARVVTVNPERASASVNNAVANTNSITLNITHYAFFNEHTNNNASRSGSFTGDDNVIINDGVGGSGTLNGESAICLTESAPLYVPFRP